MFWGDYSDNDIREYSAMNNDLGPTFFTGPGSREKLFVNHFPAPASALATILQPPFFPLLSLLDEFRTPLLSFETSEVGIKSVLF